HQLRRERSYPIGVTATPTKVHPRAAANGPTQVRKLLSKCREDRLRPGIVFAVPRQHPDAPHALALLRPRHERPSCRAADKRDEFAPPQSHSITSSARPSSLSGKVMPSALAVLRLMTNWIFTNCWTGRSAGLTPLRMLPA